MMPRLLCLIKVLLAASVAQAALVAGTSFEVSQGYDPPGLDVRSYTPTDGDGWGGYTWEGTNGGDDYSPVVADAANAQDGDQYLEMHRERQGDEKREIKLRRRFDTSRITGDRIVFSWAMRLVSSVPLGSPDYFDGGCNVALETPPSEGIEGDKNVHLEFKNDGQLMARGADGGEDVRIGYWDDPAGDVFAYDAWITVIVDVTLSSEKYDLYVNGKRVGAGLDFRNGLDPGEALGQIRLFGPRAFDGQPDDGVWHDKITLATDFQEPVSGCLASVSPGGTVAVTANLGPPLVNPDPIAYTIQNIGEETLAYSVAELDENLQPVDVPWLSLDDDGGTLASLQSAAVTASIDAASLNPGNYTAYVKFADDCTPPGEYLRRIDLEVIGCTWEVNSCHQVRAVLVGLPGETPEDVVYRITNTGSTPVNYTVTKSGSSCFDWLILAGDAGTIPAGGFADVTASIDPDALVGHNFDDSYTCTLQFADDGCSLQQVERRVRIRYLGPDDVQVFRYDGSVDPESDDAGGSGMKFGVWEGDAQGGLELDPGADNGKVWRIQDPAGVKTKYEALRWRDDGQEFDHLSVFSEAGATVLARVKVRDHSGDREGGLFIWEEDSISAGCFWAGPQGIAEEVRRDESAQLPGDDQFHILRITSIGRTGDEWGCGRIVRLYLDENPQPVIELIAASEESDDREGLGFGAGSTSGTYDIAYDWVTGTNAGAFGPGEEDAVLGFSLVPDFCARPFADIDRDGDVDQGDFGLWQACYTGLLTGSPGPLPEACRCLDRDLDNDVDEDDYGPFEACATGPEVPLDVGNPPVGCIP